MHSKISHPLDSSAAFTALLDFCPGFGKAEAPQASRIVTRFLDGFYSSGRTDMAAYAKSWVMTADPTTALRDHIGVTLAQWDGRDRATGKAAVRRAASAAVDGIDDLLNDLYSLLKGLRGERA